MDVESMGHVVDVGLCRESRFSIGTLAVSCTSQT